jgi:transposase
MFFLEGKTYTSVAEELCVPIDTVKTWCRRYRTKHGLPARNRTDRNNTVLIEKPINRETLRERNKKDETIAEARISRLEMEVELLRNFLILGKER